MKTDEWVLRNAGVERSPLELIEQRKLPYFGHVLRKSGYSMEREVSGLNYIRSVIEEDKI